MRPAHALLMIGIAISLGGCVPKNQQTVKAAPPAPRPSSPPAAKPPPEPLSVPQTNVQLPPPQPVPPEAMATTAPAVEPFPAPTPAPPRTPARTPARTGGPSPRTEPAAPPAPVETERPPISEVTPAAEFKRLQDEADNRKQEVTQLIRRIPRARLRQQQNSIDRINAFLHQADDARRRGDMRQATELAGRALVLARELK